MSDYTLAGLWPVDGPVLGPSTSSNVEIPFQFAQQILDKPITIISLPRKRVNM